MDRKKILVVILCIVFIVTILTIFLSSKNGVKQPAKSGVVIQKPIDLCTSFITDLGEISCESAKEIALKKYPGQVLDVDKTNLPYKIGKPPNIQTEDRNVWLVHIKPDDLSFLPPLPTDTQNIGVAVDRNSKEILFFKTYYKQ